MSKFKYDESLFREFKSSNKEGLSDIGLNDEDIDKIQFEVSESARRIKARVDYSDFKNHIFFGSAYAATNFALSRLLNDYPWNGELKEKNEWKRINNGFENYFFEQYPKRQGNAHFTGSTYIKIEDHEYKLRPGTGSFAFECIIKPDKNIDTIPGNKTIFSLHDPDGSSGFWIYFSGNTKDIYFQIDANLDTDILSASYSSYINDAHHVAFVYDSIGQSQTFYVDGLPILSRSTNMNYTDNIIISSKTAYLGAVSSSYIGGFGSFFTGAMDDVRLWLSSTPRSQELIKRNYFKTIHANHSGGLKFYYKFNEPQEFGNKVVDYSGLDLHGVFSGSNYSFSVNNQSGTLTSWFKDDGDPIYSQTNSDVSSFMTRLRNSGSLYDKENRNMIFNIVPSFFVDDEEKNEDMQRFLLLIARNYDQLKIYIDNISNVYNTSLDEYGNTPDELLNRVAEHYGVDIGGVYEGASALSYIFGEDVLPSGSLDSPISTIRNQIKRNLLNNLIYILKTKSTRQAIEASLRAMGLEEDIVNINEYSIFSGGIQTSRTHRAVERKVAKFPYASGSVLLTSSVFSGSTLPTTYEVRALFNTGSAFLTSSIFSLSGAGSSFSLQVERRSLTSSAAVAKLYSVSSSTTTVISSSVLDLYDNNWINFAATRNPGTGIFKLFVTKLDRDEITISQSVSSPVVSFASTPPTASGSMLGSKNGPSFYDGHMQEFRAWYGELSHSLVIDHAKDFESLSVENIATGISSLFCHLKLNDFTGSVAGHTKAHDYVHGLAGSSYDAADDDFESEGKYIYKLDPSYSYDFAINNDKVRTKSSSVFTDEDIVEDIPYLSVDMSPVASLNKEIVRWFGDLEKFNNIIGQPYNRYRHELEFLNQYRHHFFSERLNGKISFKNYLNLLKWFDSNFTYFLSQLIPADMASSLSSFVIEPHLFEFNKITYPFPSKKFSSPITYEGSALVGATATATRDTELDLADPGRFGSPVSASAELSYSAFDYSSSLSFSGNVLGVNFKNQQERSKVSQYLRDNSGSHSMTGYGNGFYTTIITGSDYLKNTLNVNDGFCISGVHSYPPGDTVNSLYLTAAFAPINRHFTASVFNGVTDQRWHWLGNPQSSISGGWPAYNGHTGSNIDVGIGYGGGWGQLVYINRKSLNATDVYNKNPFPPGSNNIFYFRDAGWLTVAPKSIPSSVSVEEGNDEYKIVTLWPSLSSYEPILISSRGLITASVLPVDAQESLKFANFAGDKIDIQGYKSLSVNILGKKIYSSTAPSVVDFRLKFQFFNDDGTGEKGFETVLSSSLVDGSYSSWEIENEYVVREQILPGQQEFVRSFYRELPVARYMKVHCYISYTAGQQHVHKILIKGALTKEVSDSNEKLLQFEG